MDKTLNYLGIARRSSNLVCGTDTVIKTLQANKLYLIVLANDASIQTKDKIIKKAFFYKVPVLDAYAYQDLLHATSLKGMVYGIDDKGLAEAIMSSRS